MLKSWWFALCWLIPLTVHADALWRSGFEQGDLSEWSGTLNPDKGTRKNITVVSSPVLAGSHAAELTIHPDDLWPNQHNRVELHQDAKRTKEGQTTFFAWYFMLHDDVQVHDDIGYWETANSYQQSMALYVEPGKNGMTLGFKTNKPSYKEHFKVPITAKQWHRLTMQILWSAEAKKGRVSIWLDGKQLADNVPAQTKPDGNDLFIQVGFHRDASAAPVETISIDEAIEGTSLDDVLSPAPMPAADAGIDAGPDSDDRSATDAGVLDHPETRDAAVAGAFDASDEGVSDLGEGAETKREGPADTELTPTRSQSTHGGCQVAHERADGFAPWLFALALALTLTRRARAGTRRGVCSPG